MRTRGWLIAAAVLAAVALTLPACSSNTEGAGPTKPTTAVTLSKVDEIANLLPDNIKKSGTLIVATDPTYKPNEYKDSAGRIVGFDVDLMNAVAEVLGVKADYRESVFESIIPELKGGTVDVGMSSFTDNREREQQVDFVTYFQAGSLWVQRSGPPIDPNNACGMKVAAQTGTIQDRIELPAKSEACTAAGKPAIEVLRFDGQDRVTNAVVVGQADAMTADYPVSVYAIKDSGGKLVGAGELFKTAPYGWALAKGSPLAKALLAALDHVIKVGDYKTILTNWEVEKGAIDRPVINGAVN